VGAGVVGGAGTVTVGGTGGVEAGVSPDPQATRTPMIINKIML
jgi:hypothetical protein